MTTITGNENAMAFLTIRQEFAARFMQGLLATSANDGVGVIYILECLGLPKDTKYEYPKHYMQYIALCSTIASDALITELNKPKTKEQ